MEDIGIIQDIGNFVNDLSKESFIFDEALLGYVAKGSFAFSCPDCKEVVDLASCSCGKIWNIYEIVLNGEVVTVSREVPLNLIEQKMTR